MPMTVRGAHNRELLRGRGGAGLAGFIRNGKSAPMRRLATWTCVILLLCGCGLVVSEALSPKRWVASVRVAEAAVREQAARPAVNRGLGSRVARRVVPPGWSAPRLVGARSRPGETWRPHVGQRGLPVATQAPRLWVGPAGDAALSVGFDAGTQFEPPPLAASVMRTPLVSGKMAIRTIDSLEKRRYEAAIPLPHIKLVKNTLEAMPDKCDEKLMGKWYCNLNCYIGCEAANEKTFSRTVDGDGYEEIHMRHFVKGGPFTSDGVDRFRWRVDRKWHPHPPGSHPYFQERLFAASCNGKFNGYSTLTVNYKKPDGSDRSKNVYAVDKTGKLWVESFSVRWVGDKAHSEMNWQSRCRRRCECD